MNLQPAPMVLYCLLSTGSAWRAKIESRQTVVGGGKGGEKIFSAIGARGLVGNSLRSVQALLEKKNSLLLPEGNVRWSANTIPSNTLLDDIAAHRMDRLYPSIDTYIYWTERGLMDYPTQVL